MAMGLRRMIGTVPALAILASAGLFVPAPARAAQVPCEAFVRNYCIFYWERDGYAYYDDCVARMTEAKCPYPSFAASLASPRFYQVERAG